jgi:hypothetical protein
LIEFSKEAPAIPAALVAALAVFTWEPGTVKKGTVTGTHVHRF